MLYPEKVEAQGTGRHFTVAVFVAWEGKVLLHLHKKLGMWLPPGGHIEPDELPDDAAVREVYEETGLEVELVGEKREDVTDPVQLHRPAGVQLENIGPGHQHIDLIYFAKPKGSTEIREDYAEDRVGWYDPEDWDGMNVNAEVRGWCERALRAVDGAESHKAPAGKDYLATAPEALVEQVHSKETFLRFVRALMDDWYGAREKERRRHSSPYGPYHGDWENDDVGTYPEALMAWSEDWPAPGEPSWRTFARMLLAAKSYE